MSCFEVIRPYEQLLRTAAGMCLTVLVYVCVLLQALQPLASNLRQLRINGASSLSRRSLLLLSVLANLEVLELKNCGKISWLELQQAWKAACMAHEAQAAAEAGASGAGTNTNSSGGGSSRFSSNGGSLGSKLGAWLPTGRLFRTSSPASNSIQSALTWQRTGTSSLFAKVHDLARGTSTAAAVAVAQLGIGAVGNGRSSCGGSMPEAPARSLLYRKQKEDAAAASGSSLAPIDDQFMEARAFGSASSGCFPVRSSLLRMRATKSAILADEDSLRPISMLSRVGSLVWHHSSAASAGTDSSSSDSFVGSSGSSLAAQASSVQAALQAYIAQEEQQAATAAEATTEFLPGPGSPVARGRKAQTAAAKFDGSGCGSNSSSSDGGRTGASKASTAAEVQEGSAGGNGSSAADQPAHAASKEAAAAPSSAGQQGSKPPLLSAPEPQAAPQYKPRRRTTGEKALPAMPFTKLASLTFTCSEVTLKNPGPELAAVAALTTLTALEISKCKLPDAVFANLQALRRLQKLKLTGLWSMGDAGVQHVAQISTLQSLALSEAMHVTAQGLRTLSSLSSLTSLALGFTQDLGPGALAPVVNSLPLLQCVEIAAPCWGDLDCEILAEACPATPPCGGSTTPTEAAAGAAGMIEAGAAAPPQMLWDLAGGSFSRASSRTNSSRQMVPPAARGSGNSWTLKGSASFSSMRSRSFGSFSSFSFPAGSHLRPAAATPAQPLLVLRLHGCRALTSKGMTALKQLAGLHTLVLEDCKEVRAAEAISQGLLPPKLASLTLRNLPFGNVFSNCVSMPCCSTRLTKLELASLEGVHEGQLRRLLSFFSNLSELSLAGCGDLRDSVLQHLGLLPKLQQLSLSGCSIVGHGLEHLRVLPKLRMLSLKACTQLTDEGLGHLLPLPALEQLDLSDCVGVSEQALLHVAQHAARLVRMDVTGCRAVTRGLLAACPHYLSIRHSL